MDFVKEALIVDEAFSAVHHVDGVGTLVLGCLDGKASVAELAEDLADVFHVEAETAARQLASFIDRLDLHGLLSTSQRPPAATPSPPNYLADPPAP